MTVGKFLAAHDAALLPSGNIFDLASQVGGELFSIAFDNNVVVVVWPNVPTSHWKWFMTV